MARTDRIGRFIRRWRRHPWSVATLHHELGAILTYFPSTRLELGYCHVGLGRAVIAINNGLVGTNFLIPVIAHECAHLLIGIRGLHTCIRNHDEPDVWALAATLTIPEEVISKIRRGEMGARNVARLYEIPVSFVEFATWGESLLPAFRAELDAI